MTKKKVELKYEIKQEKEGSIISIEMDASMDGKFKDRPSTNIIKEDVDENAILERLNSSKMQLEQFRSNKTKKIILTSNERKIMQSMDRIKDFRVYEQKKKQYGANFDEMIKQEAEQEQDIIKFLKFYEEISNKLSSRRGIA